MSGTVHKAVDQNHTDYLTFRNMTGSNITVGKIVTLDTGNATYIALGTAANKADAIA